MDIFSVISLLGGLALFLYGMNVMSDGLEKSSNGALNKNLKTVTKNRFLAMVFGAGLTIAVQSSSAVTVMLVGLVNSGILEFGQTIGVLMGSNIGTTLTAWILSLAGLDGGVWWIDILKPANFSPLFAFIGILLTMISKNQKTKSAGHVLLGFAILMFGMTMMSDAMKPLSSMPEFRQILMMFTNPILSVLVGAAFTGIIQSSAASVAILQAFSMAGGVTYGMAVPIIMGQNIGTCVTAVISSIGVSRNAKKVAVVHLAFNIFGTLIFLIPFCVLDLIFNFAFFDIEITPFMIAVVHSIFNIATTFILLPFAKHLEKLANKIIPEGEKKEKPSIMLDDRLLAVPSVAVEKSLDTVIDMCNLSTKAFLESIDLIFSYDEKKAEEILEMENYIDKYEDQLGTYMMKLSKISLSDEDTKSVTKILHTIDDFERIADHAVNLVGVSKEIFEKKIVFSDEARREVENVSAAIREIISLTVRSFCNNDVELATSVEPLEQVIDEIKIVMKKNHISRLKNGTCTINHGFVLNDLVTSYGRVSDHCSNIAVTVIESYHGTYDTHEYLDAVKHRGNADFEHKFHNYSERFAIK
ncbi:MAG: Na/Pi cotransporter family protein [Ruminococcaceae bacterium]|nr:Na/Pi cotransporter family protein [Oscillospiraceae bacterium]